MSRKKKDKSAKAIDQVSDKAASKIVLAIKSIQNAFARFMNKKTKRFSPRTWKILIVVFTAVWGSLSIYFIIHAFVKHPVTYKSGSIQFIVKPARNDSLAIIEQIYEQEKKKLLLKK